MPELTDDQLDGLFRKSAEEFDPPFDPAAWQDMKTRLDTNDYTMPAGVFVWKNLLRWGLPVLLLLLLTGGSWYVYRKTNASERSAAKPTTVGPKAEVSSPESELNTTAKGSNQIEPSRLADATRPDATLVGSPELKTSEERKSADRAESTPASDKSENRFDRSITPSANTTAPKTAAATKSIPSTYRVTSGKSVPAPTRASRLSLAVMPLAGKRGKMTANRSTRIIRLKTRQSVHQQRRTNTNREQVVLDGSTYAIAPTGSFTNRRLRNKQDATQPNVDKSAGDKLVPESSEITSVALPSLNELAIRPANWPKVTFTNPPVMAHPDTTVSSVVPRIPFQKGFSVRFAVAPDLSSIGLKNFSRPGTNVGLMLEYRLASRWSVQAGVIQSTKVYRALPGEYGFLPENLEKYPTNLAGIDGRCNILDIPINLRYDVVVKPRKDGLPPTRWFINSGVTSYIMNQEDYVYTYYHNYPTNVTDWNASTGGYGFSNLNFSMGYERAISRRLSWQIEPFIKAPLKGVGLFKVNLLSTGVFFSLRYKL